MGQYYVVVNRDRKEYLYPHKLGSGLKLWEICANNLPRLLAYLLKQSTGRGGGDPSIPYRQFEDGNGDVDWEALDDAVEEKFPNAGRWAGDSIAIVGDYDESQEFGDLYVEVQESDEWTEISPEVAEEFNEFIDLEDAQVEEPNRPEDCDHDETRRTVDQSGDVVRERCSDCYEVLVDRRSEAWPVSSSFFLLFFFFRIRSLWLSPRVVENRLLPGLLFLVLVSASHEDR